MHCYKYSKKRLINFIGGNVNPCKIDEPYTSFDNVIEKSE